jgi:hypothetical protein
MGGCGSTRWGWRSTRATTDEVLALDIRLLARHGVFTADHGDVVRRTISWTALGEERGQIGIEYAGATPQRITLHYCVHGPGEQTREVSKSIAVGRTACHFGDERVWFICPRCATRRAMLHAVGGVFQCRVCHDLAYRSTRESPSKRVRRDGGRLGQSAEAHPLGNVTRNLPPTFGAGPRTSAPELNRDAIRAYQ